MSPPQVRTSSYAYAIVIVFKAARLFNPEKVSDLKPTASTIEVFAFLVNVISNLKAELAS